ncbi:MAG: hypothetical protein KJ893_02580 [Candidatus Omnitrophica bacterium]|nr:hypothetical protein [Candidatus Omnitrophota bacterium]MBU4479793.1 hypothetical protein [Candidatus Omnitrophota bacterium]
MILVLLIIIAGMVFGASLLFNEYPKFLIKQIFEKCRKNQFDFLSTSYPFLSPKKLKESLAVKNYFEKLEKEVADLRYFLRFAMKTNKNKQGNFTICTVGVLLIFSGVNMERKEKVKFVFIRDRFWGWSVLDCKEMPIASTQATSRPGNEEGVF